MYLIDGKQASSLEEAKEPVWIEVSAMSSLRSKCVLIAGIGRATPPIHSKGRISVQSNPSRPRGEL